MIKITDIAAAKLKELISKRKNPDDTVLRISFAGIGWGGPKLELTLEESREKNDIIVETQGIKIAFEADLEPFVKDSVIDYSNGLFDKGFEIRGANASTC